MSAIQAPGYIKTFEQFEAVLKRTRKHESKVRDLCGSLRTRKGYRARPKTPANLQFNEALRERKLKTLARHEAIVKGRNAQLAEYTAWRQVVAA